MKRYDEAVLIEVCRQVGIGVRTLQGASREADTVRRRKIIAQVLRRREGWTVPAIAAALNKTTRAVEKMVVGSG